MLFFQDIVARLTGFWADQGCVVHTPYHTEVGAGTSHPATFLRVLGPEPWNTVYVQPSCRPTDGRYGENPNRMQHYYQLQVILKPSPADVQDLMLRSFEAVGLDLRKHDVRFVEDNWQSPSLGAWGVGWEVWLDGMEVLQFTYFQECGGLKLRPKACELTYGLERLATYLQGKDSVYDLEWAPGVTYGELYHRDEVEYSTYNFKEADVELLFQTFERYEVEANRLLGVGLLMPAYDHCLRMSHLFNLLDARGSFSATERGRYLLRTRAVAGRVAEAFVAQREGMAFPLLKSASRAAAPAAATAAASAPARTRADFLLEVGVEELPHEHLQRSLELFPGLVAAELDKQRLEHGEVVGYGTPRRLAVLVKDLAAAQADRSEEARGPKTQALKDAAGAWTVAARRFAESHGAKPEDFVFKTQGKAEYCFLQVTEKGRSLDDLLSGLLASCLKGIPFPKAMAWEDHTFLFSRPVRWLVALHGERVVPCSLTLCPAEGDRPAVELRAGRATFGHRRLAPGAVSLPSASSYLSVLRERLVLADRAERRAELVEQLHEAARSRGLVFDEAAEAELVDEVCDLIELPHAMVGQIPESALALPEQIVVTPLRKHQRYFPLRTPDGKLSRSFVVVANGRYAQDAVPVIVAGNEKVVNARLRDARFFWDTDRKVPLAEHAARLDRIVFHQTLGTVKEKVQRLERLADALVEDLPRGVPRAELSRVLQLMKADLATQMVFEFTSLEGLVGMLYGRAEGLPESLVVAMYEHKLPRRAGDDLPSAPLGAAAGLLDRIDSLGGYLGLGLRPTGSRDPMGIRRLAQGFLSLARAFDVDVDLERWTGAAVATYAGGVLTEAGTAAKDLVDVMGERLSQAARDEGAPYDLVAAAAVQRRHPRAFWKCLDALRTADAELLQDLAEHTKRMVKIAVEPADAVKEELLEDAAERELAALLTSAGPDVGRALKARDFPLALASCARFVPVIKRFFVDVLVNDPDVAKRRNRHALLGAVAGVLRGVADFTEVQKRG